MKTIRNGILVAVLSFMLLPASTYAAGTANLSMSPNSGSYTVNSTFAVTIYENSGTDAVNVVEADLSFNSAVLQLTGISCNTSVFEINAPGSGVGVTCGTTTPKTGNQAAAFANFKVIGSGSTSVSFAATSHIYRSTDNADIWNGAIAGGTFSLVSPTPTSTPTSTPSRTPTPTPTAATSTNSSNNNTRHHGVTATPTPKHKPTPTPTPTKKVVNKKSSERSWNFWGIFSDNNPHTGSFIGLALGMGMSAIALFNVAFLAIRRKLLPVWQKKTQNVIASVKNDAKLQSDAFFARLQTIPKKIKRVSRFKKS
jgi:hypothetical protein